MLVQNHVQLLIFFLIVQYDEPRRDLLNTINSFLLQNNLENLNPEQKLDILCYGHSTLDFAKIKALLKSTINFIKSSNHFVI